MAKISTYPILSTPTLNDLLIGTDVENLNITKNFSIGDIASFIVGGSYVPYVGATGNVNLGAFNITSSSFIVGGGLATQFLKANGTLDSTVYQPAGNYITQLSGEATGSGPGNATVTLSNSAVINKVLTGLTVTGNAIVSTDSILTAFGKVQNQINTLVGGVQYKGTWNAATNIPALVSSVGVSGNYYVVSVAGNTNLNGITDWNLGDWAIFNGSAWEKVDNTDAVISVNGQIGAVVLTTTNISEGTNLYFTNSRARTSINLTTTGNSGAATYNNTNGFFNIPEYTLLGLGGVPLTRQLTINGTAFDLSANRSWSVGTVTSIATTGPLTGGTITGSGTIGITQAGASSDGYLSSTDWNTFNNKQNALTNPVTGTGTIFTLPMWGGATSLIDSPLSYGSNNFNFQYNSATGGTATFTNSGLTAYAYTIQMNNFGSPRSTVHGYTDGIVVQSIAGSQVSRMFANGNLILGTGTADNGYKLELSGSLFVNTIANATVDTDRFIVSDGGVIKYRTGTELRSDIGAGIGTVTSVGLSMPSAFSVANSPITGSGTIAVTGAGVASQYVRGDGTLADFPTNTGGGSSVSYYLNGSVSQGTIGGVAYRELSETPIFGAGTDISIAADGYIASFITDAGDPALLNIPAGNWNFETYFSASSGGGTPSFYVELYRYDGTTFTLIASSSGTPELISFGTNIQPYFSTLAVPQTALALTDRLAIRYYVIHDGRTITLHTEDNHLCQVVTTFSNGLTALNGLTAQVQYFQIGTSGTDFNISSATSTHTFNLPDASDSNRGAVTTGSQVFGGVKTFANGLSLSAVGGSNQVTRIVNIGTLHEGSATLNQIGFNSANNIYFGKGLSNGGVLQWTNAAVRYYTLPDADGTLALTSNLSAYLPLTGGTLTGALNGTSAVFSGDVQSGTRLIAAASSQSIILTPNSGGSINRIEGSAGAPLHIVTSGSSLAFAAGGTTPQMILSNIGNLSLSGALNGTSASFTGKLLVTQASTDFVAEIVNTQNATPYGLRIKDAASGANGYPLLSVSNNSGSVEYFRVNSGTGAATFSSSVTAGGAATNYGTLQIMGGATSASLTVGTAANTILAFSPGQELAITGNNAAPFGISFQGRNSLAGGGSSGTSYPILINPLGGNVGIGTASPAAKLYVGATVNNVSADISTVAQLITPRATIAYPLTVSSAGSGVTNDQIRITYNYGVGFSATAYIASYLENASLAETGLSFGVYKNGLGLHEGMRLTPDKYIRLASSSGGIQFNGDTAAANALDDYEEGTWTPTIVSGGLPISINTARYTKIGRLVTIQAYIDISSSGNSSSVIIGGAPFSNSIGGWSVGTLDASYCAKIGGYVRIQANGTEIQLLVSSGSTSVDRLEIKGNEFGANSYMIFTITYQTA